MNVPEKVLFSNWRTFRRAQMWLTRVNLLRNASYWVGPIKQILSISLNINYQFNRFHWLSLLKIENNYCEFVLLCSVFKMITFPIDIFIYIGSICINWMFITYDVASEAATYGLHFLKCRPYFYKILRIHSWRPYVVRPAMKYS